MMTIAPDRPVYTVVTLFATKPENQETFLSAFKLSIQGMKKHPGFVAACVHRSLDGRTILNYLQWRSQADFETFVHRPGRSAREHEFLELMAAQGQEPPDRRPYEVVFTTEPSEEEGQ